MTRMKLKVRLRMPQLVQETLRITAICKPKVNRLDIGELNINFLRNILDDLV